LPPARVAEEFAEDAAEVASDPILAEG